MQLPIKAIRVFHTVARSGSVSKAAEELSVTPSAVSQQVQALEVQLGISLLNKMGRRVVLTEAGQRYFSMITDEIERISDATNTIRGHRTNGFCRGWVPFSTPTRSLKSGLMPQTSQPILTVNLSISKYAMAMAAGRDCSLKAWPRRVSGRFAPRLMPRKAPFHPRTLRAIA